MKTSLRNGILFLALTSSAVLGCQNSAVGLRKLQFKGMSELEQDVACGYLALIQLGPIGTVPASLSVSLRDANMNELLLYSSDLGAGAPGVLIDNGYDTYFLGVPRSGATESLEGPVGLRFTDETGADFYLDFDDWAFDIAFPVDCGDGFLPAELSLDANGISLW